MPDKPLERSIAQEMLDLLGSNFVEDVSRYIVPIFADINDVPVSMGAGFLLNTSEGHVLVTAAHVPTPSPACLTDSTWSRGSSAHSILWSAITSSDVVQ